MAEIKPVLNNFSSGEITPDAFGMVGSPAFASGAQELLNMMPVSMGGASRRGALEYLATIPDCDAARLIPWSVDDERDFLLVLTAVSSEGAGDGKLRILDVSYGETVGFLLDENGDAYEYALPYTEAQLASAKYAQSIRQVFCAQNDHPMWYIKFNREVDDGVSDPYYSFDFGDMRFIGNVAVSKDIEDDAALATDPILADYFSSVAGVLVPDTVYTGPPDVQWAAEETFDAGDVIGVDGVIFSTAGGGTTDTEPPDWPDVDAETVLDGTVTWTRVGGNGVDGIINGAHVKSIVKTDTELGRRAICVFKTWAESDFTEKTITDGGTVPLQSADDWRVGNDKNNPLFTFTDSASSTSVLDLCEDRLLTRQVYILYGVDSGIPANDSGTLVYYPASTSSSFTITFDDDTTLEIDDNTTGLTGWLEINNPALKVNNKVTSGQDIMEKVGTWLTPNVTYFCDSRFKLNGTVTPLTIIKRVDSSGYPILEVDTDTAFNSDGDNPGFVAFHQGRMVVGGSRIEPNVLFMSQVNNYESFKFFEDIQYEKTTINPDSDPDNITYLSRQDTVQQVTANSAMKFQLATEENESIRWAAAVEDLIIGTDTSEWVVPADITALNPRIVLTTRNGSTDMQGRFVNGMVVYVPRSRRGARVFEPKLGQMSQDILQHANHLVRGSTKEIIAFDFRADPRPELLMLRRDGVLLVGVMGQESIGWYQVQTREGDIIEAVASVASYGEDAVYVVVKRAANTASNPDAVGGYIRTIERMRTMDDDVFASSVYLDSYVSVDSIGVQVSLPRLYTGTEEDTWPMIAYEDGTYGRLIMNTSGVADSFIDSETEETVSMDTVWLKNTKAVIGYPYTSRLKTMRIDSIETEGLPKSGGAMHLRVLRSGDLALRREYETESNIHIATPVTSLGVRIYPYTGSLRVENLAPSAVDHCIILENDNIIYSDDDTLADDGVTTVHHPIPRAEPLTIQLISPTYTVGDAI